MSAAPESAEVADKRFATLRAQLALRGYSLHILDGGAGRCTYLCQRWGMFTELRDIDAVAAFALRVGAGL